MASEFEERTQEFYDEIEDEPKIVADRKGKRVMMASESQPRKKGPLDQFCRQKATQGIHISTRPKSRQNHN